MRPMILSELGAALRPDPEFPTFLLSFRQLATQLFRRELLVITADSTSTASARLFRVGFNTSRRAVAWAVNGHISDTAVWPTLRSG